MATIVLHMQGMSYTDDLHAETSVSQCGDIEDGIGFSFGEGHPNRGGWVVEADDILLLAEAIKLRRALR